jgi:hypothetical protein
MSRVACLAVFALAACNVDEEFVDAVPTTDQVSLKIPSRGNQTQQSSSVDGVGSQSSALVGETSELYEITWGVTATVNAGTLLTVGALRLITLQAPTSRTDDSRTWGPWTAGGLDPITYKLVVRKLATAHFGFSLEASSRLADDPTQFLPLIDGEVTRGSKMGTGHGTMVVHFDNRRTLVPDACETGTLAFTFDNAGDTVVNDVILTGFANDNDKSILCQRERATDATYHFEQDRAGAGSLLFSFDKDMVKPVATLDSAEETVTVRSRWQATGAGRSDLVIEGGDVTSELAKHGLTGPVNASQCWDTLFRTAYETSAPAELHIFDTDGTSSACVFASAELPK